MTTTAVPDWLCFLSGGVLAVVALALLARALFSDRPRGRKRCSKCWYDMTQQAEAGALTCPECGHDAKKLRRLQRTRRRWGWAVLAIVLLTGAGGLAATPHVRKVGWTEYAPSTVLIWIIPSRGQRGDPVLRELIDRFELDEGRYVMYPPQDDYGLWKWQRRLLASRCAVALDSEATVAWTRSFCLLALTRLGPDAEPAVDAVTEVVVSGTSKEQRTALQVIHAIGPGARDAVPVLQRELENTPSSPDVRTFLLIHAIGAIGPDARPAVPTLIEWLDIPEDPHLYFDLEHAAIDALGAIGPAASGAVPALVGIAGDRDRGHARGAALWAIAKIEPAAPGLRDALVIALLDPEVYVRAAAAGVVRPRAELREFVVDELAGHLGDADVIVRTEAARGLMSLGPDARPVRDELTAALEDDDELVRLFTQTAIDLIDGERSP